jgi:hypothetical protein
MIYVCSICNKSYQKYGSMYLHKKRMHNTDHKCNKCNKLFVKYSNYIKHKKECSALNKKLLIDNISIDTPELIKSTKNGIDNRDDKNIAIRDKSLLLNSLKDVIDDTLLSQVSNQLNMPQNSHNTNNANNTSRDNSGITGNNNIINNTIKIVPLGQENLSDVLTAKEQISILNKRCQALEEIIKYVHFNDKYPQFQNMMITNLSHNHAYKYDTESNSYITVTKTDMLNDLIENRVDDIDEFYNNHSSKLSKHDKKEVSDYIKRLVCDEEENNGKYLKEKKKHIELVIYNNQEVIKKKLMKLKRKPLDMLT